MSPPSPRPCSPGSVPTVTGSHCAGSRAGGGRERTAADRAAAVSRVKIAVVGFGLVGRRHVDLVQANAGCELVGVVESDPAARAVAETASARATATATATAAGRGAGAGTYRSLDEMFAAVRPDGVVVASPTGSHVRHSLRCVNEGVAVLVEKPIAAGVGEARVLVAAAESAGVPLLVGHHRRHSPILAKACEIVQSGQLGRLVAVTGSAVFAKPDSYFDEAPWRRETGGGGPIMINLIHEIDSLRALCGDVTGVQAMASR
nr:Gfo/Idh/MocA family oxidoreductase [Micromonospora sp. DSM 115978]